MITSLLYYFFLKNTDWTFGRKFSIGILFVYVLYYLLYYNLFENQIYSVWFLWGVALDVFILGILLVKYKNMKFHTFVEKAVYKTI